MASCMRPGMSMAAVAMAKDVNAALDASGTAALPPTRPCLQSLTCVICQVCCAPFRPISCIPPFKAEAHYDHQLSRLVVSA